MALDTPPKCWHLRGDLPELFRAPGGVLFQVVEPIKVDCYAEGRKATSKEIVESIKGGLPSLKQLAEAEGPHAMAQLKKQTVEAMQLLGV